MSGRIALLVTVASFGITGCQQAERELESRRAELGTRASIERYGASTPETYALQEAWVGALKAATREVDPRAITETVRDRVVPALAAYHAAIAALPAEDEPLRAIHALMVAAHGELLDRLKAFAADADPKTYDERRKRLADGLSGFNTAQTVYLGRLGEYYEAHGVALLPSPPLRLAESAPAP